MTPEESIPSRRPMPKGAILATWVIYDRPKDFPQGYVLRAHFAMEGGGILFDPVAWYADDPDKLRAIVPPGKVKLMPMQGDDLAILETWV